MKKTILLFSALLIFGNLSAQDKAALVNPMAEKEWKRKEKEKGKGNRNDKERKSSKNELHTGVPIPGRKRNDSGGKGTVFN